jgi:hypothetical protein
MGLDGARMPSLCLCKYRTTMSAYGFHRATDHARGPGCARSAGRCLLAGAVLLFGACDVDDSPSEAIAGSTALAVTTTTTTTTTTTVAAITTSTAEVSTTSAAGDTTITITAEPSDVFECPTDHPGEWVIEPGAGDIPADGARYVVLNGRRYEIDSSQLAPLVVGDQIAEVCFNLTDMRFEMGTFQPGSPEDLPDGDAWRVAAGTPIHALVEGDPLLRLAAMTADGWRILEVFDVPEAATPHELIDLVGPFASIVV